MTGCIVPNHCPYCKGLLQKGDALFQCGVDMTGWPDVPPVSLYAHRACWQASRATVILPLAVEPALRRAQGTVQASLFSADNALLAGGI